METNIIFGIKFKRKIEYLVKNFNKEIAGYIIGEWTNKEVYLEDILIPFQEVGGANIDMNEDAILKLYKENKELFSKIIGEWHSHVNMSTMWSTTDVEDLIKPFMKNRDKGIFVVSSFNLMSKEYSHRVRLELDTYIKSTFDDLDHFEEEEEETQESKRIKEQIKKYVEKVKLLKDKFETIESKKMDLVGESLAKDIKEKVKIKTYKSIEIKNTKQNYLNWYDEKENSLVYKHLYGEENIKQIRVYCLDEKLTNYIKGSWNKQVIERDVNSFNEHNFILGNFKSKKHYFKVYRKIFNYFEKYLKKEEDLKEITTKREDEALKEMFEEEKKGGRNPYLYEDYRDFQEDMLRNGYEHY